MFQILELPSETGRLETYQALLVTKRVIFLESIYNSSAEGNSTEYYQVCGWAIRLALTVLIIQGVDTALSEYEVVCSQAVGAGVDIVTKEFSYN